MLVELIIRALVLKIDVISNDLLRIKKLLNLPGYGSSGATSLTLLLIIWRITCY